MVSSVLYGELTALVDATQVIDDALAPTPQTSVTISETFTGAQGPLFWPLSFLVDKSAPPAQVPALTVNGQPINVSISASSSTCPEYRIEPLSAANDMLTTGTAPPPQPTDVLLLTYNYLSAAFIRLQDPAAMAAYAALPNVGKFAQATLSSVSGLSMGQALAEAETVINGYSTPFTKVDATLGENYSGQGFKKLQTVVFTSNRLGMAGLSMLITGPEWAGGQSPRGKKLKLTMEM